MERLIEVFQPGFHTYHPFRVTNATNPAVSQRPRVRSLQELCKYTILSCITLRELKLRQDDIPLPRPLIHFLQNFTTEDFHETECAPFVDIFDFNFYHRAVTYKVCCKLDGCEYLATHGATQQDLADATKFKERNAWISSNHSNLMLIYGTVLDELTGNLFYIMNVPQVSLEHIQVMLFSSSLPVPEVELWTLAYQLSSVLLYIHSLGLYYGPFGLDNVFMVNNQIALENELTRKSRFDEGVWSRIQRSSWQPNVSVRCGEAESLTPQQLSEAQSVWYLGFVISKFASTHGAGSPLLFPIDIPQSFLFYKRCMTFDAYKIYSPELCQLIVSTQNPNFLEKPSLTVIRDLSVRMIGQLRHDGNSSLSSASSSDEHEQRLPAEGVLKQPPEWRGTAVPFQSGLLDLAKCEYATRKQPYWR